MDLNRFSEAEWASVRERLGKRGGWSEVEFVTWLTLEETEARLEEAYGGEWTLYQALDLATGGDKTLRGMARKSGQRKIKRLMEEAERGVAAVPVAVEGGVEELEQRVRARVELYLDRYTQVTLNDKALLGELAKSEVAAEVLQKLRFAELGSGNPQPDRAKRLGETLATETTKIMAIQKMLGIDKATRDKEEKDRTDLEEVRDLIESAGEWVEKNAVAVKHCDIIIGFFTTDFREFPAVVVAVCPRCRGRVVVEHVPGKEDLRAVEPVWVLDEERKFAWAYALSSEADAPKASDAEREE